MLLTWLVQLFRGEFIFPPDGLIANLEHSLSGLEKDDVIKITRNSSGNITAVGLSDAERQCGRENFDFYCFLIWPFIEATWLGAVSLMGLTPPLDGPSDIWVDLNKAQDSAQRVSNPLKPSIIEYMVDLTSQLGKTLYHQGDLSYFEAVNKESLKNAYQRFAEEGIILVARSKDQPKTPATIRLAAEWTPQRCPKTGKLSDRGRLWDFTEKIAQSRREGCVYPSNIISVLC